MMRKMIIGGLAGLAGGIMRVTTHDLVYMMLAAGVTYYALDALIPKKEEVSDAS
jgi:hypothetical protein